MSARRRIKLCEVTNKPCEGIENHIDGEVECKHCHRVIQKLYSDQQEWRNFSESTNDKSRVTMVSSNTTIGQLIGADKTTEVNKQKDVRKYVEQYCAKLGLDNNKIEEGMDTFFKIPKEKLRNKKMQLVAIGIVGKISQRTGLALTDISNKLEIDLGTVKKGLKLIGEISKQNQNVTENVTNIIYRICSEMNKVDKMFELCKQIEPLVSSMLEAKHPKTVVAVIMILVGKYINEKSELENEIINKLEISVGNVKTVLNSITSSNREKINDKIKEYLNKDRN